MKTLQLEKTCEERQKTVHFTIITWQPLEKMKFVTCHLIANISISKTHFRNYSFILIKVSIRYDLNLEYLNNKLNGAINIPIQHQYLFFYVLIISNFYLNGSIVKKTSSSFEKNAFSIAMFKFSNKIRRAEFFFQTLIIL